MRLLALRIARRRRSSQERCEEIGHTWCGCLEAVDTAEIKAKEVKISSPRAGNRPGNRLRSSSNEWASSGGDEILVEVTGDVQARAALAQLGTVKHCSGLGEQSRHACLMAWAAAGS